MKKFITTLLLSIISSFALSQKNGIVFSSSKYYYKINTTGVWTDTYKQNNSIIVDTTTMNITFIGNNVKEVYSIIETDGVEEENGVNYYNYRAVRIDDKSREQIGILFAIDRIKNVLVYKIYSDVIIAYMIDL
jgi:hypothetical protein